MSAPLSTIGASFMGRAPGAYKLALLLMALLVLIEGLLELMPPVRRPSSQ